MAKSKKKPFKNQKLRHMWNIINERLNSLYREQKRLENEVNHTQNMCDFLEVLDKE